MNRYRVRPSGNNDPDCEFDVESLSPSDAAKFTASIVGHDTEHRRTLVEVYVSGVWVEYTCTPKKVTTTVYEVS